MNPTKKEKEYWNKLCSDIGCIACLTHLHKTNIHCLPHHISGRSKKGCHMNVIPLCPWHHDRDQKEGIHFMSRRAWEAKYGKQTDLKDYCDKLLENEK